jgi:hypothetical protein
MSGIKARIDDPISEPTVNRNWPLNYDENSTMAAMGNPIDRASTLDLSRLLDSLLGL